MLVLVGAALAVKLAGPVVAAVAELVHVLVAVAAVIVGLGAVCVGIAGLAVAPPTAGTRATAESQRALPGGLHLHLHGVTAEDIAAILNRRDDL